MSIKNSKQLMNRMNRLANNLGKSMSKSIEKLTKDTIKQEVYNQYTPIEYTRSYSLLNSIASETADKGANSTTYRIGHDINKLTHTSIYGGSVGKSIPEIVQTGTTGAILVKGYWSNQIWYKPSHTFARPRPYMEKVHSELGAGKLGRFASEGLNMSGVNYRKVL